ncbi:hypothetical protein E2542_SST07249 [Spatholobus suberectus]|nr:hypothetical protein E2542_SST07249 [Spatholobus suberectus]
MKILIFDYDVWVCVFFFSLALIVIVGMRLQNLEKGRKPCEKHFSNVLQFHSSNFHQNTIVTKLNMELIDPTNREITFLAQAFSNKRRRVSSTCSQFEVSYMEKIIKPH